MHARRHGSAAAVAERWRGGGCTVRKQCQEVAIRTREATERQNSAFDADLFLIRAQNHATKRKPLVDNKVLRYHVEGLRGYIAGLLTDWSESPSQKSVTLLNPSFGVAASKYLIPEYFQAVMKKTTKQKGSGWRGAGQVLFGDNEHGRRKCYVTMFTARLMCTASRNIRITP